MIKKLIDKLWRKSPGNGKAPRIPLGKRVDVPAAEHRIDPSLLDERAVRVVRTLQEAGFEAYIVGGAVRDLLVGRRPKDFDVATNATPEQVKDLFRRAFIIGRRFRIVHVVFGRGRDHEVIEVSTFRAYMVADEASGVSGNEKTSKEELAGRSHAVDASGRVLRDNVWGPQIEDAARRDFTVNAMYYDPTTQIVVDYHGGIKDAQKKVLRMIGDPETRYREDPVRIVRAVRFAAKLGFEIEPKTHAPIAAAAALLDNVPASRLFDEMIKLLQTGHARESVVELRKHGLVGAAKRGVFPILDVALEGARESQRRFVDLAMADTDRRVDEGRSVAPSFMLSCLLWHDVQVRWAALKKRGTPPFPALQEAIESVFNARIGDISGRGKLAADMREIWMMQPRFDRRSGNAPYTLIEQPRFRAGFDFLRLRADAGEIDAEIAEWWEDFSLGTDEEREALIAAVRETRQPRRVPKAAVAAGAADSEPPPPQEEDAEPATAEGEAAPRKRRRRRRKPGAARADDGGSPPPESGSE
jgi:poly(A) polymerase